MSVNLYGNINMLTDLESSRLSCIAIVKRFNCSIKSHIR